MRPIHTLIALMLMLSGSAFAQITAVPQQMNFQGRLTRPDGTPVPNGTYSVRFSLWNLASGGTAAANEKWNQTVNVIVRNGTFTALLNTSSGAANKFRENLFLEIKIGTNAPLSPRQPLTSVAYAMKADSVKDGSITSASIANGSITAADLASTTLNNLSWLLNGNSNLPANSFLGTTSNHPLNLKVNNRRAMLYTYVEDTSDSDPANHYRSTNVLGGSDINAIGAGILGATIAGGGYDSFNGTDEPNSVFDHFGTVGGGRGNTSNFAATVAGGLGNYASGGYTFVGGGYSNSALSPLSTVAGGYANSAHGGGTATVGGGLANTASGENATVPGGYRNFAGGNNSFAAGRRAQATHHGTFVWADGTDVPLNSTADNQFLIRAAGGVTLSPGTSLTVGGNASVSGGLAAGGNLSIGGTDLYLKGRGGGVGNNGAPGRALVDGGPAEGLVINYRNDFGAVNVDSSMTVHGPLYVTYLPFGDHSNVQWEATTGLFYYDNSSRRYKENITPLQDDFEKLLQAVPVTYTRPGAPNRWEIGFIAEDFDALGLKKLVDYGKDGITPEGINYEKICLYLTAIAKRQAQTLKSVDTDNKTLKAENAELKARLDALAAAVEELKAERK